MNIAPIALPALVALVPTLAQAQLQFRALATVDLASTSISTNPQYIGTMPSAIAWDGATLIVAGFNGGATTTNTALVRVSNVFGTPSVGVPTIGTAFGAASTPAHRGYFGIAVKGGKIAAAFDSGSSSPNGVRLFNGDGSLAWQAQHPGVGGVDFDPGFGGVDAGVSALATTGAVRRALLDPLTGQWTYTTSNGALLSLNPGATATSWRDHAYDSVAGDLYARHSNDVSKHVRTAGNAFAPGVRLVDVTDAPTVPGQNIEFMQTALGKLLVYNDRSSTASTTFANAVKFIDANGVPKTYTVSGATPAAGDGLYDFSWDRANARLAILDASSRKVYVLQLCDGVDSDGNGIQDCFDSPPCCTGDVAAYCTAGTAVMGCVPRISAVGVPSADATSGFEISVEFVPPQRQGLVFYGFYEANQPWAPFNPSFLCVAPPVQRTGAMSSGGSAGQCNGLLSLDFNAWRAANPNSLGAPLVPGQTMRVQGWYRDPAAPAQTNLSDALRFTLCAGSGNTIPPVIWTCANPVTISTGINNCVGVVPDLRSQVVVTDDCTAVVVTQVPAPGTTVGVGVIPVVLRARDAFQNAVTCSAQLTIVDGVPPAISAGATNQLVSANVNCFAVMPDFTAGVVATDVCSPPVTLSQSPVAGTVVPVGLTFVTVSATDAVGNVATSSASLTVSSSPQCLLPNPPPGFVPIQPGTFQMGQVGVAEAVTTVVIGYPFYMSATEVTQGQYLAAMGNNPSWFGGSTHPVEKVSWFNARAYCAALNAQQAGALPVGYEYRLPTEAEWEYTCRAGTITPWNVGNSINCASVNFGGCSGATLPVGSKAPNAWGLYDMHGNVWEWCLDSFAAYPGGTVLAPFVTGGGSRIFRGGSWNDNANLCMSAFRNKWWPDAGFNFIGFRVVLAPILVP